MRPAYYTGGHYLARGKVIGYFPDVIDHFPTFIDHLSVLIVYFPTYIDHFPKFIVIS